jgi:phosphatidylinositol alpha-1,6-mannosyltransferase
VPRTLVVTNDFPPRRGGIETFVHALTEALPPGEVVVYTARMPGHAAVDAALPFPVVRDPAQTLLPLPSVARRTAQVLRSAGCDRVLFGAAAPLGLLAPALRKAGAQRIVALTHGHETWWAKTPGTRSALRRIAAGADTLTFVSRWCRDQIAAALPAATAQRMRRLSPGVDTQRFRPGCGGAAVRERLGIAAERPVVVCAARMVARKGQDTLVRGWRQVLSVEPDALLLFVGDGPHCKRVAQLAAAEGVTRSVVFAGSVPWSQVAAYLDAGNVFAMPCRTRLGGLEPEALGIVFLEAAACALPVVVGNSGGAPETVLPGRTGHLVDPLDPAAAAGTLAGLLTDPALARQMGRRGRAWVESAWTWSAAGARLRDLLDGAAVDDETAEAPR